MAYIDQSSNFGYGTILTSTQMQNLRDNLAAAFAQDSGAPTLVLPASCVTQGKLKTDVIEMSRETSGYEIFTNIGYGYCFLPQTYCDSSALIEGKVAFDSPILNTLDSTAAARITLYINVQGVEGKAIHCDMRYVTASGEVFWVFLKVLKNTKKIVSMYCAPDHPCWGSGSPELHPHPFLNIDLDIYDIIVINPNKEQLNEIEEMQGEDDLGNHAYSISYIILNNYDIELDDKIKWPDIPITIGIHAKTKEPVKKIIPKPEYIKLGKLIKKNE